MSPADQYPGPAADSDVTPWGVPVSVPPTSGPGGHLPSFGTPPVPSVPQAQPAPTGGPSVPPFQPVPSAPPFAAQSAAPFTQFPGVQAEPESHLTQVPLPPSMRSPYGAPLQQPRLLLDPRSDALNDPHDAQGAAKRRKTLIASSLAAVAVVGVGAAVALMGAGSPQKTASLADASHDASASASGSPTSAFSGKPDGDNQAGAVQAGAVVPTGDPSSITGSPVPGQPVPSSSGAAKKPAAGATHTTTGSPVGATTQPGSALSAGNPPVSAPGTTAQPPAATTPKAPVSTSVAVPPPPSTDCTYLDLPAAKMPVISRSSPGSAAAVKQLQCLMKKSELGIKPLAIDGVWGPDTQSALTAFQQCNNAPTVHSPGGNPPYARLTVNGVANQQTWADLYFWDAQYFNGVSYYCNGTR